MARRFLIVSYDVTSDRRRERLAQVLQDYGDRVQYSVFCCQLSAREKVQMQQRVKAQMNQQEDRVLLLDAGPVVGQLPEPDVDYLGRPYKPSARTQVV